VWLELVAGMRLVTARSREKTQTQTTQRWTRGQRQRRRHRLWATGVGMASTHVQQQQVQVQVWRRRHASSQAGWVLAASSTQDTQDKQQTDDTRAIVTGSDKRLAASAVNTVAPPVTTSPWLSTAHGDNTTTCTIDALPSLRRRPLSAPFATVVCTSSSGGGVVMVRQRNRP